jgi:hypothetical protein
VSILLSDEQIQGEVFVFGNSAVTENGQVPQKIEYYRMVCKAQLKAVIEWLDAPCTEHLSEYKDKHREYPAFGWFYKHRKDCPKCWAELKEEL